LSIWNVSVGFEVLNCKCR